MTQNLRPMTGLDEPVQQFVLDSQKNAGLFDTTV